MAWDFWNNPLVVSSFRVKNRQGKLFTGITTWVFLQGAGCVVAWYLLPFWLGRKVEDPEKLHLIFLGLLAIQTILSALMSMSAASVTMMYEVANGTLDYQRLTQLSPVQILVGKLLGPPATYYLAAMASLPFTLAIWGWGVPEISFGTLLLLYLNVATTIIMAGSIGLLHSLHKPETGEATAGTGCLILLLVVYFLPGLAALPIIFSFRGTAALVGLFLPLGPMVGLYEHHDPWFYPLSFFGAGLPFLLVTPLAQLTVAALCFKRMIRRLINPMTPGFSKPMVYVLLAVIDLMAAAVLFEPGPLKLELGPPSTHYWLYHVVAAFFLAAAVTPDRELLLSWLWRFRGRCSRSRDLWREDRSENILVLLTLSGIGLITYLLLVALPALLIGGWEGAQPDDPVVLCSLLLGCVLPLSVGTFYQSCVAVSGRVRGNLLLLLLGLCDFLAFLSGILGIVWLPECSVVAHWVAAQWAPAPFSPFPLLVLHGLLFLGSWLMLRRNLRRSEAEVDRKLREMGVLPAA